MSDDLYSFHRMKYYTDRGTESRCVEIADQCVDGILYLWDACCLDLRGYEGNPFRYCLEGSDSRIDREYLYTMDYLSYVLTAYRETGKEIYQKTFEWYMGQFCEFLQTDGPFLEDLPIFGQILVFIKAYDVLGYLPCQDAIVLLMVRYAAWLMDDGNYFFDNNHGIFSDLALLHLSVFLEDRVEACLWREHAVKRLNGLFQVAYLDDDTNNENSLSYFDHNNIMYDHVVSFCRHYGIGGIDGMESKLEKAKSALETFAHKDCTLPVIGDGKVFRVGRSNSDSRFFPDMGMAVIKLGEVYLSFKGRTTFQAHAHMDISSITAQYKGIDFLIDSGQYNYDRYTPINRFVRSAAGHSGIFPLFADGMFQKEFCETVEDAKISAYACRDTEAFVRGKYRLKDVQVLREVTVTSGALLVRDSWRCEKPTAMRQRFVLPKELIPDSRFTASERVLETYVGKVMFRFEIASDTGGALTTVSFGVTAPQYNSYETTMLLDTVVENTLSGEITARITFW